MGDFEKTSPFGKGVRPSKIFQQNDKLRRNIYAEIRKLNKTLHTGPRDSTHAAIIEKFIDAMIPSDDPGRLPINASKTRAPKPSKPLCVFYLVSCLIQIYWEYLKDESEINLDNVKRGLGVLKTINKRYNTMEIIGDEKLGYVLKL